VINLNIDLCRSVRDIDSGIEDCTDEELAELKAAVITAANKLNWLVELELSDG
jgi:hypothetical protein